MLESMLLDWPIEIYSVKLDEESSRKATVGV